MPKPTKAQVAALLVALKTTDMSNPGELHAAVSEVFGLIIEVNPNALYEMFFDYVYRSGFGIDEDSVNLLVERVEA